MPKGHLYALLGFSCIHCATALAGLIKWPHLRSLAYRTAGFGLGAIYALGAISGLFEDRVAGLILMGGAVLVAIAVSRATTSESGVYRYIYEHASWWDVAVGRVPSGLDLELCNEPARPSALSLGLTFLAASVLIPVALGRGVISPGVAIFGLVIVAYAIWFRYRRN